MVITKTLSKIRSGQSEMIITEAVNNLYEFSLLVLVFTR